MELSDYEKRAISKFGQSVVDGMWTNDGLVSLLKVIVADFLQAKRVSRFASDNKMTTQWARQRSDVFEIDGYQFIPDND